MVGWSLSKFKIETISFSAKAINEIFNSIKNLVEQIAYQRERIPSLFYYVWMKMQCYSLIRFKVLLL